MGFAYDRFIPSQTNDYLSIDFNDDSSKLIAIKSNMGTGKTEQLIRWLPEQLKTNTVIMLSVRQTLSTSWSERYRKAGIKIADYRDQTGRIEPVIGDVQII